MKKNNKFIKVVLIFETIAVMICMFACGYKVAKDEMEAKSEVTEITTRLEEERVEVQVEINDIDTFDVINDRHILEEPEVYEEYYSEEAYYEEETEVYTYPSKWEDGQYIFSEDEIWEMTRIVYLENGIDDESTDTTLYLTACVILNRLYDWEECNTVYEVIWQGGQYSTANRYEDYNGSPLGSYEDGWNRSYAAVCSAIENCDRNPHFQATFSQGEVYYIDPNTGETFCY